MRFTGKPPSKKYFYIYKWNCPKYVNYLLGFITILVVTGIRFKYLTQSYDDYKREFEDINNNE